MAVVILPTDKDEAQAKLQSEIDDPFAAIEIVVGEGDAADRAIEVGVARASLDPLRRHVVWVRDPSVLSAAQRADYVAPNVLATFVGLDNKVHAQLSAKRAVVASLVEEAFTDAGG